MIYVFGNSHANTFTKTSPGTIGEWNQSGKFLSFSLGPIIAYNFTDHHYPKILSILNQIDVKDSDYIFFAVGEVDHRWHLPKRASMSQLPVEVVTNECVDRFFGSFIDLKNRGYKIIGWGSHPSTVGEHNDDPGQPVFGDCLTRNLIGKTWNNRLSSLCSSSDIPFVSIFDDLVDEYGITKMEYYMDYCHLDPNKISGMLEKSFEKF